MTFHSACFGSQYFPEDDVQTFSSSISRIIFEKCYHAAQIFFSLPMRNGWPSISSLHLLHHCTCSMWCWALDPGIRVGWVHYQPNSTDSLAHFRILTLEIYLHDFDKRLQDGPGASYSARQSEFVLRDRYDEKKITVFNRQFSEFPLEPSGM